MEGELHLVLGATGAVGRVVVEELQVRGLAVKAVERTKTLQGVETIHADLLDPEQAKRAIIGASHVYVCIGLPYNSLVWERQWPPIIQNIIEACHQNEARLILLDNVYMYGPAPLDVPFTETHETKPGTKKGRTRHTVAAMVMEAHRIGKVRAVIGRAADFYGPFAVNSVLYTSFVKRVVASKSPQSMGPTNVPHTYSYTCDSGRALVELGLDDHVYGEVWHLPVSAPVTGDEIMKGLNEILDTRFTISVIPRWLLKTMGIFVPIVKESNEMLYQFDDPYVMSDLKFRGRFPDFDVTDFDTGLREMVRFFKKSTPN